jgi:nucleoid DNA-binding protein
LSDRNIEWSRNKLKTAVKNVITEMFTEILDFAEVAVDGQERFKKFRSKVLRSGNNAIRDLNTELTDNYNVEFTNFGTDLVVVKNNGKGTGGNR